ncbi:KTSC domain-containing protein [Burkholderia cenocepacia]|uniref:KTSC domain-containing protein n=1 Tax=Burkholderia cenocepacia TaxID=95486 RepID=UPI0022374999|nr:KTSC domain-containing protein [Burkholderia cenocepacia]MCW5141088.1 KTSC domain-containing protein [Burkholderia cenocepacia]
MPAPTVLRIDMTPVESSQIHSIGYDPQTSTLAIRFKNKDGEPTSLYHYDDFTPSNFDAFRKAESIGSHFYRHIKPFPERFPYTRIESKPAAERAE